LGLLDEIHDRSQNAIETELQVSPTAGRLDPDIELHLFRILQQACHNTLEHATAKWLCISGFISEDQVSLVVKDNGSGFSFGQDPDLPELLKHYHFGLAGMVERAMMIGAEVHFANHIDVDGESRGARVFIDWMRNSLPVQKKAHSSEINNIRESLGLHENQELVNDQPTNSLLIDPPENEEPDL